ncbi:small multidrug efflux protein [Brachybacterium sp. YJGR34]|uniref:small multidrug efflux protein n=1 Tax=Brachybacterium sp. YJGR34 TaxID=2059911 RepID=UPI000E09E6A7|nr:small multidrug efflux protein [Brachybacterium sp. YJGR34]
MDIYEGLQNLIDQVPPLLQPVIVALVAMIPYVEGEGAAMLGLIAGINPVVAAVSAAAGNIFVVTVIVHFGDRIRSAIVGRRRARAAHGARVEVMAGGPAPAPSDAPEPAPATRTSKGRERLLRWVVRFGVPGASLIGPLALPTHLTAATLVATGVRRNWVLLWQVIAIVMWTTVVTLIGTGILTVVTG